MAAAWLPVARDGSRSLLRSGDQAYLQDLETGEFTSVHPFEAWLSLTDWVTTSTVEYRGMLHQKRRTK